MNFIVFYLFFICLIFSLNFNERKISWIRINMIYVGYKRHSKDNLQANNASYVCNVLFWALVLPLVSLSLPAL